MISLLNRNQVVENQVTGSRPESQILKVRLTGWTRKAGNSLPSRRPTPGKRYRKSCFCVQWYTAWFINARETLGISCLRPTKEIILWWRHVFVLVLWINSAKWTQSFAHCISISRLNALKNMHGKCMMYSAKLPLSQKVRLEETHLPDYQRK